jgi:uncharacterized protein HemX
MNGIMILFLALLPVLGFGLGVVLCGQRKQPSKEEKAEHRRLQNFEADAMALAYEHLAFGDPLAAKIIDLRRKEIQ